MGSFGSFVMHLSCLNFFHNDRRVTLHPNPAYQPVITLTVDFRSSVIDLAAFCPLPFPTGAGGEAAYLVSGLFPLHLCGAYKDTTEL